MYDYTRKKYKAQSLLEIFAQTGEQGKFEFIQHLILPVAGAHGVQKPEFTRPLISGTGLPETLMSGRVNEPARLLAKLLVVGFRAPRNEAWPANTLYCREIVTCRCLCKGF